MVDRLGQQMGNYRLTRLLGRGGFAEVYLGEHLRLKTQAAIKVLSTALEENDIEGFLREAQTVARLKHPHIVRVFDFDVQDGNPFLVMDYLPNGSIRRLHPKRTSLSLSTIVSYVTQVASALQYAHDEKVIHRDVKPENMLLDRDGTLLLSDFGIAIMAQSSRYQSTQEVAGTAAYMAPEQFLGHPHIASDQYALGIVVYEWLSGDRPFHGTFSEIASQHMFVLPPSLYEKVPTISPDIELVVHTALAKDPKQPFASVLAFARAFEQASQVKQLEHKPAVLVSKTTEENESQQPTAMAAPVPVIPLSQQKVSEISADLSAQPQTLQTLSPSSGNERLPQVEEETRQKQEQADNIDEERVRKEKEAEAAQKAEEERVRKEKEALVHTARQESTPSHLPPTVGPRLPQRLRFRSWKALTLLLVLALLILGSGVGLYSTMSHSSSRTQATATAQANSAATAQANSAATAQANSAATAQTQALATATARASIPGKIWHAQNSGTAQYLHGVAWSRSQFVVMGFNGTILTSPDGRTWSAQNSGTGQPLADVAWSGSQFVAVGGTFTTGTILTSPDGRTWSAQNPGTLSAAFNSVAWSGSQFVAVGYNGRSGTILTSPDGRTWSAQNPGTGQPLADVAWLGSQFVAVGFNGTILTSPNGRTWSAQNSGTTNDLSGIAWSGSQFVAVGGNSTTSSTGTILTSPDGRTWSAQNPGTTNDLSDVAWSGSQFVAVGGNSTTGTILTSPNGRTWSAQSSGTSSFLSDVAWSGSRFVVVGGNGTILTWP